MVAIWHALRLVTSKACFMGVNGMDGLQEAIKRKRFLKEKE
jgi:hypothetical protein